MTEEPELQRRSSQRRLFELDALRGLAAVSVVLFHLRIAFSLNRPGWYVRIFSSGREAVVLFFIMSGYVLSLPYWTGRHPRYAPYLVRRLFRIYLPFAAAVLMAAAFAEHYRGSQLTLTPFFAESWHTPISARLLLTQLLMWPTPELNVAFWSLRYEMQMSLVLPLLCWALKPRGGVWLLPIACVLLYARPARVEHLGWHYVGMTLQVAFLFACGASLARYRHQLERLWNRVPGTLPVVLAFSLPLYYDLPSLVFPGELGAQFGERWMLLSAVGAAGILLSALHGPWLSRLLRHPLPEYLGRISYSLYLVHGVVLFAAMDSLYGRIPNGFLIAFILAGSFAAAHLFCVLIEEPCTLAGRALAAAYTSGRPHEAGLRNAANDKGAGDLAYSPPAEKKAASAP
ncbi:MAG: acyltransferase [Acidobacteriaceae bacterium]